MFMILNFYNLNYYNLNYFFNKKKFFFIRKNNLNNLLFFKKNYFFLNLIDKFFFQKDIYLIKNFKNLLNFFKNFFINNRNLLIFDILYDYNIFFFYHYNIFDLVTYSDFFFPKKFIFKNKYWEFFLQKFCDYYNISCFVIIDFLMFKRFFKEVSHFNIPVISLYSNNFEKNNFDFLIKIESIYINILQSFLILHINSLYFLVLNLKLKYFKLIFFKFFEKINLI